MRHRPLAALGVAVLVAAACTPAAAPAPTHSTAASLSEFKIALDATTLAAGDDTFNLTNKGTIPHEFVIVKTDVADASVPKAPDGSVDEENAELSPVTEQEDIAPGATVKLAANLPAGHYVFFCNLPGHYAGGMHGSITVTN